MLSRLRDDPSGVPYFPFPTAFLGFLCFSPSSTRKGQACLSWQDMAWDAKEALEEAGSAARDGTSQLLQTAPSEAAANCPCPIFLDDIENIAYVVFHLHCFCLACFQQWARGRGACPLCRQPLERVLHTGRADDDYEEYVVSSPTTRGMRPGSRADPCRGTTTCTGGPPTMTPQLGEGAVWGPTKPQRHAAALGPSNATSHQAPTPSISQERTSPRARERSASPAAAHYNLSRHSGAASPMCWPLSHPVNIQMLFRAEVFQNQRTTHCRECFPTLSQWHGKSKQKNFLGVHHDFT